MKYIKSQSEKFIFRRSIVIALGFVFLLWLVRAWEDVMSIDLGGWGILPRTANGLVGIITAPLIHGSAVHLLSNTFPLVMLLIAVFYFYDKIATEVFVWIYIITGFWVWVIAREAYHIGASGLVYGLAAFLFFSGVFRKDARSMAVSLVIAFIHGGMVQGLVPTQESVSWESHLLGSAAGVFCSFYFRKLPQLPDKKQVEIPETEEATGLDHTFSGSDFSQLAFRYTIKATNNKKEKKTDYNIILEDEDDSNLLL